MTGSRVSPAAIARALEILPKGEGGRCAWCSHDHRFGRDSWPAAELADHERAVRVRVKGWPSQ